MKIFKMTIAEHDCGRFRVSMSMRLDEVPYEERKLFSCMYGGSCGVEFPEDFDDVEIAYRFGIAKSDALGIKTDMLDVTVQRRCSSCDSMSKEVAYSPPEVDSMSSRDSTPIPSRL